MDDQTLMPFGKHKGKPLEDVPAHYLSWLFQQSWFAMKFPDLYKYISKNLDIIQAEMEESRSYEDAESDY